MILQKHNKTLNRDLKRLKRYLHGPGSARSQAVPCVKTCSSLSALQEERLKIGEKKVGFVFTVGQKNNQGSACV